MKLIKPMVIVEDSLEMILPNGVTLADHMAKKIELFTRKCYKSEGKMTEDSYKTFPERIFNTNRHTGIAEHRFISVTFITDRGISHEGVRHRMAAYLQESTRYCDYSGKGVAYILPPWMSVGGEYWDEFLSDLHEDDERYARWRNRSWTPEKTRYFLPTGVKTEYAATLNLGSWNNFLSKRTPVAAHPQMRQIAIPLLRYFRTYLPQFFNAIPLPEQVKPHKFLHKGSIYEEAELIVNPYYDQVLFPEVYSD